VSKVGASRDSRRAVHSASRPDELRAGVEANLQTLHVDALALVNLRLMGHDTRGRVPLADQLGALTTLQDEGKIEIDRAQQRTRR
jgi:pyridoxine 4-dehydrogenase